MKHQSILWSLLLGVLPVAAYGQTAPDTLSLPTGIRYVVHTLGTGAAGRNGNTVLVHYTGFLPDGKMFESSAIEGRPVKAHLGEHDVIPGWEQVLPLLPAGTRAWVYIPAALAYGAKGVRDPDDNKRYTIPPNTDLRFELNVVRVK
ncbi:FKBP-type peptidyl-prolyl cis-trans isomerase [Hymenobacter sp. J193]|uniref:FKBP-type peptidyl-prolyl cis-trans isomerase n=1 Tax=Hymenobacter sp. J193 TaxID=2898429 RepID=UPI002151EB52|nr:FKBP-type peptidyl-prolyl cis-trans isomerase [Hymenobacter sp. J193]MCR5887383.1 FKBP-type peptidyl-prolyl cis-trans isomerase [Hymenobacter sp. J193]